MNLKCPFPPKPSCDAWGAAREQSPMTQGSSAVSSTLPNTFATFLCRWIFWRRLLRWGSILCSPGNPPSPQHGGTGLILPAHDRPFFCLHQWGPQEASLSCMHCGSTGGKSAPGVKASKPPYPCCGCRSWGIELRRVRLLLQHLAF